MEKFSISFRSHPSQDLWEKYKLCRLPEDQVDRLEEHLMVCAQCLDTVEQLDQDLLLNSIVPFNTAAEEELAAGHKPSFRARLRTAVWPEAVWPRVAWAGAAMAILLAVGIYVVPHPGQQVAVALVPLRDDAVIQVPAGERLSLELDPAGATLSSPNIQIVDPKGSEVWSGKPQLVNGKLKLLVPRSLSKGLYYRVRILDGSELVKEYGVHAE